MVLIIAVVDVIRNLLASFKLREVSVEVSELVNKVIERTYREKKSSHKV